MSASSESAPSGDRGRRPFEVTYRWTVPSVRRPRFLPFLVTGGVLGFLVGAWLAGRPDEAALRTVGSYSPTAAVGYLGFLCAGLGALLAAGVALLLEKRREDD